MKSKKQTRHPSKVRTVKPAIRARRKVFIAIAGNIGSGKSSLTRLLSQQFGWTPYYESVEDNPYLSDFYANMTRWSFNLQVYFLSNRFRSHKAITEGRRSVILDRVIYEDAEIFARNLFEIGNMEERDYTNYVELYKVMTEYLRAPDLLIYLRANVQTLQKQIALRGRDFEQSISKEYLEQLNRHYEAWTTHYTKGPLLTVESDTLDFVNSKNDLNAVVGMIKKKLRHKL
ncbi:MAG: Deoxyadenosine/deoxycytidine kinase [Bacteroidetes bacterium]|nr:Deoxyadenosine/deoxycytidine kinase [Bacteroidota bacterium]